jgi:hypothetical protein
LPAGRKTIQSRQVIEVDLIFLSANELLVQLELFQAQEMNGYVLEFNGVTTIPTLIKIEPGQTGQKVYTVRWLPELDYMVLLCEVRSRYVRSRKTKITQGRDYAFSVPGIGLHPKVYITGKTRKAVVRNCEPSNNQVDNAIPVHEGDQILEVALDIHSLQPSIPIPEHPERSQAFARSLSHPKLQVVSLGGQISFFDSSAVHDYPYYST